MASKCGTRTCRIWAYGFRFGLAHERLTSEHCISAGKPQARVLLVEGRADHTLTATEGRTALDEARHKGHHECVELLEVGKPVHVRQRGRVACCLMAFW